MSNDINRLDCSTAVQNGAFLACMIMFPPPASNQTMRATERLNPVRVHVSLRQVQFCTPFKENLRLKVSG
jgi:hypothetical protein